MAVIGPFRGVRYASSIDLQAVVAPPYDVLSAAQATALAARSPYNAVRVDLPVPPGERPSDAAYRKAAELFGSWRSEGVLARDEEPAVYLLEQTFRGPDGAERVRRGLIARLRLATFDERVVLPHEHTHAGPKEDRLRLYRATHADLSPIFLLCGDDDGRIGERLLAAATEAGPAAWRRARTDDGAEHRLGPLKGQTATDLAELLEHETLYIADGHHRYETALAYRDERRAKGDGSADTLMVYLCAMDDPGLVVFPTHRLVRDLSLPPVAELRARLAPAFDITASAGGREACGRLVSTLSHATDRAGVFVLYSAERDESVRIELRDLSALERLEARGVPARAARLSVTILHGLVLGDALGLEPAASEGRVAYASSLAEAFAKLDGGEFTLAAFLNPATVQDVRAIADQGEVMPQKSTYFFPKLPTGLVFDALGE